MDILTTGLIIIGGYTLLEGLEFIKNHLGVTTLTWYRLTQATELQGYKIEQLQATNTGYKLIINIPIGGTVDAITRQLQAIEKAFKCKAIVTDRPFTRLAELDIITMEIQDIKYKFIPLDPYTLLVGYNYKGEPITVNMQTTAHILSTGLSGNGKTRQIKILIKNVLANNNADIVVLNGFLEDYKGVNVRHIVDHNTIKDYLQDLLEGTKYHLTRPLYLVIEELGKIKDKQLMNLITRLLQYGRHTGKGIFVIGVVQESTKTEIPYKSLFNARISFKQIEESSYKVCLGCNVPGNLKKREFYLYSTELIKGKTYLDS